MISDWLTHIGFKHLAHTPNPCADEDIKSINPICFQVLSEQPKEGEKTDKE